MKYYPTGTKFFNKHGYSDFIISHQLENNNPNATEFLEKVAGEIAKTYGIPFDFIGTGYGYVVAYKETDFAEKRFSFDYELVGNMYVCVVFDRRQETSEHAYKEWKEETFGPEEAVTLTGKMKFENHLKHLTECHENKPLFISEVVIK